VEFGNVPGLRNLIQHLPLPLVFFGNGSDVSVANDRFADVFEPGQLDSPDLRRLAQNPGGAWESVTLRQRDGLDLVTAAKAVAVADGMLLVFDVAAGPNVMKEIERLRERITELESLRATDPLTGAWNRVHFERMVQVEMSRAIRSGLPLTLILLDLDHFKQVNDDYGHLAGDTVLTEFVRRIRQRTRNSDSLFRWGGEEFLLLTTSVGYRGGAALAEDLRRTIAAEPFAEVGPITISLGVAEYIEGESAIGWFQRVDQALYAAKSAGRNRVHVDRQGRSDLRASGSGTGVLRLQWLEAYECGGPTIDAEHRELFDRGNALIATAIEQHSQPGLWRAALESTLAHLGQHFHNEEALLRQHGYGRLAEHQRAHAGLLRQANELKAAVERGEATLGHLVDFLVNEVIVLHILKIDRDFYPLFQSENGGGAEPARA
jgi:diguanylate cyclase (GGDEF)-like protein/hemerythrin-like metal-binding protein